jgi:hypothetical protein
VLACVGGHVIIELVVVADVEDTSSVWWWDNVWDLKEEYKCCRSRRDH